MSIVPPPSSTASDHAPLVADGTATVVTAEQPAAVVRTAVSTRRWALDSILTGLIGGVLAVVGLVAVTRAGVDSPLSEPVTQVLGFDHTAGLGFIEIGIGALLLLAAAFASRGLAVFVGTVTIIGAVVGAIEADRFRDRLALEEAHAWWMVVVGALVVAVSLLVPRWSTRVSRVDTGVL